ncbi:MFS transporter [Allokutzneria sp. A3M-2-11 16]|uniref:MFS transporter n=1 Tax=Allokutzneria sp. A3M-2-11 16 TaxID=2962043 RepID=UPI0020B83504|nr:MFS transporter [Allokutzneria sp. A3M-2-11 16]MCP3802350.1 MFS transporter [Allokutzneria sp. A3M-2-11 16]
MAFWTLATTLFTFMAAAAAPSPLYVVYQAQWGFTGTTLTVVFGVYALALLAALVTVGALSDHVGRRPVLLVSLAAQLLALIMFVTADGVGWLVAARVLQGLATGAATGAITAGLVDVQPAHRPGLAPLVTSAVPGLGLGLGALGSGLLVEYAPAPTTLVFVLLIAATAVMAALTALMPETSGRRPGALASLLPRLTVPGTGRRTFFAAVPIFAATWGVAGLYLSLGPSLVAEVLHLRNHLVSGAVVCALMIGAAVGSVLARGRDPRSAMVTGASGLAGGLAITLMGLHIDSLSALFLGTAVSGLGFGIAFLGAFATTTALAVPERRAALFATVYTVNYLAFSLPAIVAGAAATSFGLAVTADVYGLTVIVISLAAAVFLVLERRKAPATVHCG